MNIFQPKLRSEKLDNKNSQILLLLLFVFNVSGGTSRSKKVLVDNEGAEYAVTVYSHL